MFVVERVTNYTLAFSKQTNFWLEIVGSDFIIPYNSDEHIQYSIVPPGISPIIKSCLIGVEDMLQCLWFVVT